MAYDNTNRGTMGRNKLKEKDTHPEFSGKCNIDGAEYWISGWVKESNGEKFFSLSFRPKAAPQQQPQTAQRSHGADPFVDDDIPFANPYRGKLSYVV